MFDVIWLVVGFVLGVLSGIGFGRALTLKPLTEELSSRMRGLKEGQVLVVSMSMGLEVDGVEDETEPEDEWNEEWRNN